VAREDEWEGQKLGDGDGDVDWWGGREGVEVSYYSGEEGDEEREAKKMLQNIKN
jgi:hypothetical protein